MSRLLHATVLLFLALSLGCDEPAPMRDAGAGADASLRADSGAEGDADTPSADAEVVDASATDGGAPAEPRVEVVLDAPIVETSAEAITEVTVRCVARFATGIPMADPGDFVIAVEGSGVTRAGDTFTFAERGSHRVTCASASLGRQGEDTIVVAYEAVDRDVIRLAGFAAAEGDAVDRAVSAGRAGDEAAVRAVAAELSTLRGEIDLDRYAAVSWLVPHPNGWPTVEEARAAGETAGPDDVAFAAALSEASMALGALETAIADLPTDAITESDELAYRSASERLARASADLAALSPSPIAVLEGLPLIDRLVSWDLPRTQRAGVSWFADQLATASVPGSGGEVISLIGPAISMAAQHALGSVPSYSGLLKDLMRATITMGIQLALRGLIEETYPPTLGGPAISGVFGRALGALSPGLDFEVDAANYDPVDPNNNVVIIIPPNAPDFALEVEGVLGSVNALRAAGNWLQVAKAIWDGLKSIGALADGIAGIGSATPVIHSIGYSTDGLMRAVFPPAPTMINCNIVPRIGYVIPLRVGVGYGESVSVLVPAERC